MNKTPPEHPVPSPLTVAAGVRNHHPGGSATGHGSAGHAGTHGGAGHASTAHHSSASAPAGSATVGEAVSGAQALVRALESLGVDVLFGIPGGAIQPAYDPIAESTVRHIQVRHEQGAGHAATGYAQATGKVGVCIATSGPGATNLVTPIADAYMDSVPVVAITGQVSSGSIGSDAFQEADIQGITLPITKHNYLVGAAGDIPRIIAEAFHLANTGRPGPVLVDIPKDLLLARTTFAWPPTLELPGYRPTLQPHAKQIREAARLIATARRPVLYVGGGAVKAGASTVLARLAELTGAPVVTTLMARGAFPDSHHQHLGMPGMHGSVAAVYALQSCDLIVALGARFDDRVTGKLDSFAPGAAVIHADIDPAEIGKNRPVDVPIVGDARYVIEELAAAVAADQKAGHRGDLSSWWSQLDDIRARFPLGWEEPADGALAAPYVISRLGAIAGPQAIFTAGVGRHQLWAAQFVSRENPGTWLTSGGLGTMGYAVPAAMGAKVGAPQTVVWAIDGDGGFQMTSHELATCAVENIPVKVAVINNGNATATRQPRRAGPAGPDTHYIPDFVKLAVALGGMGLRCQDVADLDRTIETAMTIDDVPVVVDFMVGKNALTWPMVGAGTSQDEIMFARKLRPVFDNDDL